MTKCLLYRKQLLFLLEFLDFFFQYSDFFIILFQIIPFKKRSTMRIIKDLQCLPITSNFGNLGYEAHPICHSYVSISFILFFCRPEYCCASFFSDYFLFYFLFLFVCLFICATTTNNLCNLCNICKMACIKLVHNAEQNIAKSKKNIQFFF